jgi:multiple antibiotic resistance protein
VLDQLTPFLKDAGLSFFPLFVAIDPIGGLALTLGLLRQSSPTERRQIAGISTLTAAVIGLLFLLLGRTALLLLGIGVAHFAIAGGIVLLALALQEIVGIRSSGPLVREELVEVVPIGTPLLAGPATITALLLLGDLYGLGPVLAAFALNLLIAWAIFRYGLQVASFLGRGGLLAFSKIMSMFLAAIAVRLIIQGALEVLG